jgi:hypothetical protein
MADDRTRNPSEESAPSQPSQTQRQDSRKYEGGTSDSTDSADDRADDQIDDEDADADLEADDESGDQPDGTR